jgi:hypothetical protein
MKIDDIKFRDFVPTTDEMIDTVHEALTKGFESFKVYPWNPGEIPSRAEIEMLYKEKLIPLTGFYLSACILLEKECPTKYRDSIERMIDPDAYFKRLDETEKLVKMTFDLFMSTNPSLDEAVEKLIQISGDYWGEKLTTKVAKQQINEMFPDRVWRGQIIH